MKTFALSILLTFSAIHSAQAEPQLIGTSECGVIQNWKTALFEWKLNGVAGLFGDHYHCNSRAAFIIDICSVDRWGKASITHIPSRFNTHVTSVACDYMDYRQANAASVAKCQEARNELLPQQVPISATACRNLK